MSNDDEYDVDPRTGIRHKTIPKSEYDKGIPRISVDMDPDDLDGMAAEFIPHLRVCPTEDEIRYNREQREEKMKARRRH